MPEEFANSFSSPLRGDPSPSAQDDKRTALVSSKPKRGQSGLSMLVAVNKPRGMSSHDVVNAVRRIFGEKRVGHTGTLDPLATGVLPICIGPATRLDNYLTGHDKRYRVRITFGFETTTDDSEGEPTVYGEIPSHVLDETYASSFISSLVGEHEQMPPRYSAIKVNGVKSYEAARKGSDVELSARRIRILEARMLAMGKSENGHVFWDAEFLVSKGTYIRSLARDIGRIVGCPAHVGALHRIATGCIDESRAVSLDTLEQIREQAVIDPVAALGLRYAFADSIERFVVAGNILAENQLSLYEPLSFESQDIYACTASSRSSNEKPYDGEIVCVIVGNKLKALYSFSSEKRIWKPSCVFSTSVARN